ncbi:MAG: type II toxin-antitoxin system VapC family toxin [Solirubrobacterales bacterium]
MVLDSSAVLAVLFREQGHERIEDAMRDAAVIAMGAPTLFETAMVAIGRFDLHGGALVAQFLERWGVEVTPFLDTHHKVALDAFIRYGKGRHPAALNYGDCMTYAAARLADMPLLFTGDDFAHTDVAVAA